MPTIPSPAESQSADRMPGPLREVCASLDRILDAAETIQTQIPNVWELVAPRASGEGAAPQPDHSARDHHVAALLERVEAWVASVEGTPSPWKLVGDMADFIRRLDLYDRGTAQPTSEQEIEEAARELIAAEDEMHQRDSELTEAEERDYDLTSQGACLDRAIEARHAYTDARKELVALLADSTTPEAEEETTDA